MGVVTNGSSDHQREKIERTHINGFFEAVIISGEVGIGKPDMRIFNLALEKLTTSSDSIVLVGDSLENDIQGAQNVGMRAIWVNRSLTAATDQKVVPTIKSLNELAGVL